jgi:tRNA (uracil-5-)-methyltransferase TRM9
VLRQVHGLLEPGGRFIHSEWQFQHSARLMARRLPWGTAGLRDEDLEEGDTLLDWRHALAEQAGQTGLRYVHLFSRAELADLAVQSGFAIEQEFESDGEGSRLGLYQVWRSV